jgi:glycosyltransferase involved in cell wall biosynthesis
MPHANRNPLNVAIVAPTLGILGGQAVQAARLLKAWQDDPDIHAWLVPINPVPPGPLRHLTGVKFLRTIATQSTYWPSLFRELRRADVVHVFSASYYAFLLATLPAVLVARVLRKPIVMNYRSGEAPDHLKRSAIARAVLRRVDSNAVPSTFLQGVFASFAISADVVPNIIDLEQFGFRSRAALRPRLLSTRNFEELYNVVCTLRAFAAVQARFPDATLTLVGKGSTERALRELAAGLRLRHVEFAGAVSPHDIWRYYAEADIYVQTPDVDNMPSSVIEAFASGCVVVSTEAGGVPAILTDGVHGLLAPCGDHEAVAERIIQLLENPVLSKRLAASARDSCERYRWSAVRELWLSLYRKVVTRAPTVPASAV